MKKGVLAIGKHHVKHGDIMSGIDDLMQGVKVDIVYSDPPWGQGNLKYWNTINKKTNLDVTDEVPNYAAFLNKVFEVAFKFTKNIFLCEYGVRWREDIIKFGQQHGFIHNGLCTPGYRAGSSILPFDLHLFSKLPIKQDLKFLEKYHDYEVVTRAAKLFIQPGQTTILDPCCGLGNTAKIALEHGMTFYGNEINWSRLQRTIEILKKDTNA